MILSLLARTQISWGNVKKKKEKKYITRDCHGGKDDEGETGRQAGRQAGDDDVARGS